MRTFIIFVFALASTQYINAQNNYFKWSKSINGSSTKRIKGMTVDNNGNVITSGFFTGTIDVDPGPDSFKLVSKGNSDIFIVKQNAAGNFLWGKSFGGKSIYDYESANDITSDIYGNIYITGVFDGAIDFDPGPDSLILNTLTRSSFVCKYTAQGNLIWAKSFDEKLQGINGFNFRGESEATSLEIGSDGTVFTSGTYTGKVDFNPGIDSFFLNTNSAQVTNAYISKLDSDGNFQWAKSIDNKFYIQNGNTYIGNIDINGLALDNYGNVFACGSFFGEVDFNPGTDSIEYTTPVNSSHVIFILKLNESGNYTWAKSFVSGAGYGGGAATDIIVDSIGNVLTTGYINGNTDFDPGPGISYLIGYSSTSASFVNKLDSNGNYVWAKSIQSNNSNRGNRIALDQNGNIYTTGYFSPSADFDPGIGTQILLSGLNTYSSYLWKLSNNGNFISASSVTGKANSGNAGECIVVDGYQNVYIAGYFYDTLNVIKTKNSSELVTDSFNLVRYSNNVPDAFILKIGNGLACASTSSNTNITLCSNQVPYTWNGINYSTSGTYTKTLLNAAGCDSVCILNLTVISTRIDPPASVYQQLVQNTCNGRIYRFQASNVVNAAGYNWTIPTTLGGTGEVVVDSGDITRDKVIKLRFTSNAGALVNDSISVNAYFSCGISATTKKRLTNTALNTPAKPASIVITSISPKNCGAKLYRYTAPLLTATLQNGSLNTAPVTGYLWSFSNTDLGNNAVIDSGDVNSRIIVVRFTSLAAAVAGDSVKVAYTSLCGNSINKSIKLTNLKIAPPLAPLSITVTPIVTNVCNNRTYRYTAPILPVGTASTASATGYLWSFTNSYLWNYATIDSGSISSRTIVVKFTNNIGAGIQDSIRLSYTSVCGTSPTKAIKLTNTYLQPPAIPTGFTVTKIPDLYCGYSRYRLTAPASIPSAGSSTVAATGYNWNFQRAVLIRYSDGYDYEYIDEYPMSVLIDSGSFNSRIVNVSIENPFDATYYLSYNANFLNDYIRLSYSSNCGFGVEKSYELGRHASSSDYPSAPATITISAVNTSNCGNRIYRYSAPALPAATATKAAAIGYDWTLPTGPVGSTGTLDSGSLTGRVIRIKYTSNNAASAGDSIRVAYNSICGLGAAKAQKLTNTALACSQNSPTMPYTKNKEINRKENISAIEVYPNPSNNYFNIKVNTSAKERIELTLSDISGRTMLKQPLISNKQESFGKDLKPGVYFLEIRQGNEHQVKRVIKLN